MLKRCEEGLLYLEIQQPGQSNDIQRIIQEATASTYIFMNHPKTVYYQIIYSLFPSIAQKAKSHC